MKQYQDERTLQVRNRIYAELMRIMLCVVVLSFCIKTLYFHMGLTQCMTEYILMILAPVYQAVRIRQTEVVLGIGQDSRKRTILDTLLLLLLIPFFLRKSEWTNGDFSALLPLWSLCFCSLRYSIFFPMRRKNGRKTWKNAMTRRTKPNKIGKKRKKSLRFSALYGNLF